MDVDDMLMRLNRKRVNDDDPPSLPPDPAYLPSSSTAEISISEVNQQESVDLDPSASSAESSFMDAPMLENPEPLSEINQESMNLDPSSSLLSLAAPQTYDVFLSFRGADTRNNFVSHLYRELETVGGIKTFKDDRKLEIGDTIGVTLLKAIEESKCAIVVLSKNYAQSTWCLEELAKICQCMKDNNRILPLFYDVEPSDVRFLKNDFAAAFDKHDRRQSPEEVKEWREALKTVANISGCETKAYKDDAQVIEALVERVCSIVRPIENEFIICSQDFELFEATRKAMNQVMEALKNEQFTTIGVYGMGGVGKTTMVEHVGVEAKKQGLFREVIMANISENLDLREKPDLREIRNRLAYMLGLKLDAEGDFGRACQLKRKILSKDRILIILDNIWEGEKRLLTSIGIPEYDLLKPRNSKVLLTTRIEEVCGSMGCQESVLLKPLAANDSWKLFVKTAGLSLETPTNLDVIATEVAKECAGLPIALVAVAKTLRGEDLEQWKNAAERLKMSKSLYLENKGSVNECIKLSYDFLKSPVSKFCLLLCCLFPEGCDIQIEDLVKYWIENELFPKDMQEARYTIQSAVKILKDSSLLLDGIVGCVRMHDVVRDVAISIVPEYFVRAGFGLLSWPPRLDQGAGYTAISLMKNKIHTLPQDSVCSKLQILLLQINSFHEIPEKFFQSLKELRVLDLSQTSISLLPPSFNFLSSLHSLYLDDCVKMISNNISLLRNLGNLQILSMRGLRLEKLPEEVGHLTKLRMLDFTSEHVCIVPSNVIGNLKKLEELYMQCNFVAWRINREGSEVGGASEENASFDELTSFPCLQILKVWSEVGGASEENASFDELTSLPYLKILKVFIPDPECLPETIDPVDLKWKNFDISISKSSSSRELPLDSRSSPDTKALTLDTTINTLPEWFIDAVTKKTEKLQYKKCQGLGNIILEYHRGSLHELKYLYVIGPSENLEQLMDTRTPVQNESDPVFENLEELHLLEVNCLGLCIGDLPFNSLCNLKLLVVSHCHKFINALLQSNLLRRLHNLEELRCEEMDGLEYVFSSEGSELEERILPKLKVMRLKGLGNLIEIWKCPAPREIFHHVKILVVSDCNKLKSLFTSDIAHHLHDLEDLSVETCHGLERVIEASVHDLEDLSVETCHGLEETVRKETVRNKIVLPKLKKLSLEVLHKLTRFYGSTVSGTNDEENIEFPILETSHVERCTHFTSPARDKYFQ